MVLEQRLPDSPWTVTMCDHSNSNLLNHTVVCSHCMVYSAPVFQTVQHRKIASLKYAAYVEHAILLFKRLFLALTAKRQPWVTRTAAE